MTCTNCVNNRCLNCSNGDKFVAAVPRQKHEPSAWERRWIEWARKEKANA